MVYPTNKIIPLYLLSINRLGRCANMYMAAEKHIIQIISNKTKGKLDADTVIGCMIAVIPKTDAILKIFEPIILPINNSFSCFKAAITDAASSGTLVPIAIMVTAIIRLLTSK